MATAVGRYCTVQESLKESLEQMKLMREGKLPKTNWRDMLKEIEEEIETEKD